MRRNFRTKVYRMAWETQKETGKSWPVCLAKAWNIYRFSKQLHTRVIIFAYEKKDRTLRKARGTLANIPLKRKRAGKETYKTIPYYDIEAQAFRSFRIENFITIYETNRFQ